MIVIQKIQVWWGKKSRGAPGAKLRNAVPKALPTHSPECPFLFEEYHFSEYENFKPGLIQKLATDQMPDRIANLFLEYQNDALVIGFHWDNRVGKPGRYDKRPALSLRSGEYGRLIVNGRHNDYDETNVHWYSQETYNIALLNQLVPALFTSREPDQICDLQANLF